MPTKESSSPIPTSLRSINFPAVLTRYDNWLKSSDAKRRHKQFIAKLEEAYATQKGAEFGDKSSLNFMMDAVAEGPQYAKARVSSLVGAGYRIQAAPSSAKAMKALRLLKDANAIPAFEMAALRSTGDLEDEAAQTAEILRAIKTIGNQHANIPFWGETGWNLGALKGSANRWVCGWMRRATSTLLTSTTVSSASP